jgi:signal peptidase II
MFFIVLFAVVALDQLTKYLAIVYLQPASTVPVINRFFYLTYVENTGAAFGILRDKTWLLSILTIVIIIAAILYIFKSRMLAPIVKISMALIVAGAMGNLIDRIRLGYVIDFFDFTVWPVFNIADISVVIGTAILVFVLLFDKHKKAA